MEMLHGQAETEDILDEEHGDVLVMEMPNHQSDDEEWKIDYDVVDHFVNELKSKITHRTADSLSVGIIKYTIYHIQRK